MSTLGVGAKANHLSYVGDGTVGAGANIGAGTIFCNYDGFIKHRTEIGEGAFVGSNTSLVAPVKSRRRRLHRLRQRHHQERTRRRPGARALAQEERPGWAAKFRAMMAKRKAKAG